MEINYGRTIITAEYLARMFVNAGDDEQSEFLNLVGKEFKQAKKRWEKGPLTAAEMQCCFLSEYINQDGKDFIYCLANFLRLAGQGDQRYSEFYHGNSLDY